MVAAHLAAVLKPAVLPPHKRGCTGKVPFESRAMAYRTAREVRCARTYLCRHCGNWHITTTPKDQC